MDKPIIFNGYECKILKVWTGGFYDLQTKNKTKLGIIEQYLSVPEEELCVGKPNSDTESGLHLQNVNVSTSKDYNRLFEMISKGLIVPCFVDYDFRDGTKPFRDVAKVKRFKENSIQIGARGIQYGGVDDFALNGRTELKAFTDECERMNLEYCC